MRCAVFGCKGAVEAIYAGFSLCIDCHDSATECPNDLLNVPADLLDYIEFLYDPAYLCNSYSLGDDFTSAQWRDYTEIVIAFIRRTSGQAQRDYGGLTDELERAGLSRALVVSGAS